MPPRWSFKGPVCRRVRAMQPPSSPSVVGPGPGGSGNPPDAERGVSGGPRPARPRPARPEARGSAVSIVRREARLLLAQGGAGTLNGRTPRGSSEPAGSFVLRALALSGRERVREDPIAHAALKGAVLGAGRLGGHLRRRLRVLTHGNCRRRSGGPSPEPCWLGRTVSGFSRNSALSVGRTQTRPDLTDSATKHRRPPPTHQFRPCHNERHAHRRTDSPGPDRRHRSRAPEGHRELDMVRSIDVHENGVVDVTVSLTTPGCPIKSHFQTSVVEAVRALDGVTRCERGLRRALRHAEVGAAAEARAAAACRTGRSRRSAT